MKFLISALSLLAVASSQSAPVANTTNGTVSGLFIESYNQDAYLGIPYAQPPLDSLRFKNPAPLNESWGEDTRVFDKYAPSCWPTSGRDTINLEHSEDCLTLNIVKPHGDYENLPVGIWIHGGGFQDGSGTRPAYNLSYIVDQSVKIGQPFIGVSINYRLSGFGFLNSREVGAKGWTNVGLRDQIKALEWINENIANFGGNPEHLVIWGESAGAISVGLLLVSDHLGSYIKGGIMQSGVSFTPGIEHVGSRQDNYEKLTAHFGCDQAVDSLECLQKVDAKDLTFALNTTNGIIDKGFGFPYYDGDVLPKSSYQSLLEGNYYKVPVLLGTNTDEGTMFTNKTLNTREQVLEDFSKRYQYLTNSSIEGLIDRYPVDDLSLASPLEPTYNKTPIVFPEHFGDYYGVAATAIGDLVFIAPTRITSRILSSHKVPVYKYRFNIQDKPVQERSPTSGATHFQEVSYVFFNNDPPASYDDGSPWNTDERSYNISSTISKLWASFISDLDPNVVPDDQLEVPNPQGWPAYFDSKQNIVFDLNGIYLEEDTWREEQFNYIESLAGQLTY